MAGIYHNATLGLISLSSDGENWITIADKNLGATQVWNSGDTLSETNTGKYYQWGNNYGFSFTGSVTTSSNQVNAQNYGPGNYYSSSTFIIGYGRWDELDNGNLWGGVTGTNEAMQGPCPDGFHVPLTSERQAVINIWTALGGGSSDGTNFGKSLKLPLGGRRNYSDASVNNQGTYGYYWSPSRQNANNAYYLGLSSSLNPPDYIYRAYGSSVRPFKNEAVIPDYNDVWDTLYGDELPDRPPVPTLKWLKNGGNYYYFDDAPIHASSITLNKNSINFSEAGQTEQLTATVSPDDAVEKKPHWSSSDLTVAFVDQTGLVTCITPGSCTITAECDGVSSTCSVSILQHIDYIVVGGGGAGGGFPSGTTGTCGGGGGGGGAVCVGSLEVTTSQAITVSIGAGGVGVSGGNGCGGGCSSFGDIIAYGGCGGGGGNGAHNGGNSGSGYIGGAYTNYSFAGGGAGASGDGCQGNDSQLRPGNGGPGLCGFGGGGGGGHANIPYCGGGEACDGGGTGDYCIRNGNSATNYGGGGGGTGSGTSRNNSYKGGDGCQGVVIVCYKTDGSYGITCATGGTVTTSGDYTVHTFTSDGTFCIIS